ncbi:MAG: hypothetical protein ACT4PV_12205 [Planctomycetaceae bacterium]
MANDLGRFRAAAASLLAPLALLLAACGNASGRSVAGDAQVESCMQCHNGAKHDAYAGPGIENPHPFPGADKLTCTVCHGGNPNGANMEESHVPPPPEIGDRVHQEENALAFFNRRTLAGVDKFADYTVGGRTYSALDWLQFVNPGDLRVVTNARSCGVCHAGHAESVSRSPLATETGILAGATYQLGVENAVPSRRGLHEDTASDLGFRAVADPAPDPTQHATVPSLLEFPVFSVRGATGPDAIFNNPAYDSANLPSGLEPDNRARTGSPLANLFHEQIAFTCGDCHLGSAGANNRYGDFRSSGCTSCHMPYSRDGRSGSRDPNVVKTEPLNPDAIRAGERSHIRAHRIVSVAKTLPGGAVQPGIDDHTCAGCHQGSNRTVMQFWGIRLDQNQDLRNRQQYPANPARFVNTAGDPRLFDAAVGNRTFNGRNANQYILFEDYDGDLRDDTPADVHYEAGMGCIDCHGSSDIHGRDARTGGGGRIPSRMEHAVTIQCEDCHGRATAYAATVPGTTYAGLPAEVVVDSAGNPQRHVARESDGHVYLTSRLDGRRHFVPQTRDLVVDSGKTNPFTGEPLYSPKASYAMGRDDGLAETGTGPQQANRPPSGFSHADSMNCASCHAAWTNTCIGCHLKGEYDNGNNFSNITGQRIVFNQANADFTYQSPVFFQLGVNPRNRITQVSANTKVFFQWIDRNNQRSQIFAFTDRNGGGNNPDTPYPSLGHNAILAHSIRGKATATNEGPRYCVACHLTEKGLDDYGALYEDFRAKMANYDYAGLDFAVLQRHFGQNPGNQMNSPLWIHMVAGLGSGLFLFDRDGGAVNPLDNNANRVGSEGTSPAAQFDLSRVAFDLDRIVVGSGRSTGSSNHAYLEPFAGPGYRDGAQNPALAGPLGAGLIRRLTDPATGIVLNTWINADGVVQGEDTTLVR